MNYITASNKDRESVRKALDPIQRLQLIYRVFEKIKYVTASWELDHLGSELAYLALAISTVGGCAEVDWTTNNLGNGPGDRDIFVLFENNFPPTDVIWAFIET